MNKILSKYVTVAAQSCATALASERRAKMKLCSCCAREPCSQVCGGLNYVGCSVCGATTHGFKEPKYAEMAWNADLVFEANVLEAAQDEPRNTAAV